MASTPCAPASVRVAAIDIGTVTCRLLVADVDAEGLHELRRAHAITNLGEGVVTSGVLLPQAMQRVNEQMARFMGIIEECRDAAHPEIAIVAMATSAARDARNSDEFTALLAARSIELSVIPGEREAELSFKGASSSFPTEPLFVVDVGGGSTEVIAVVACLAFACVLVYPAARDYYVSVRTTAQQQAEYDALIARSDAIQSEVDRLSTPEGIEDRHFIDSLLLAMQPEMRGDAVDVYVSKDAVADRLASARVLDTSALATGGGEVSWVTLAVEPSCVQELLAAMSLGQVTLVVPGEMPKTGQEDES